MILDTHTTHSTAHVLDNMETIQHDFSVWKKLFSQVIVRAKHIHSNDFHSTSDDSIIFKKVISNNSLCSSLKNSDDIIRNHYAKIVLDHFHPSLLYFLTKARCWDKSLTLNIKSVQN